MNIFRALFFQNQGSFFLEKQGRTSPLSSSSYVHGALDLHRCDRTVPEKKNALFKGSLE